MFLCACLLVLPHIVDTYISCCVRSSFSSFIFWSSTVECCSSSLSAVHTQTHTTETEFTQKKNNDVVKSLQKKACKQEQSSADSNLSSSTEAGSEKSQNRQTGSVRQSFCYIVFSQLSKELQSTSNIKIWNTDWDGKQKQNKDSKTWSKV